MGNAAKLVSKRKIKVPDGKAQTCYIFFLNK